MMENECIYLCQNKVCPLAILKSHRALLNRKREKEKVKLIYDGRRM